MLVALISWRFLGLVSVGAAQSLDQMALRPSVIKRIRHIDVTYITHIASHACMWLMPGRPSGRKTLLQHSSLIPLGRECYEGEVQPYRKTDYKPIIYIYPTLRFSEEWVRGRKLIV